MRFWRGWWMSQGALQPGRWDDEPQPFIGGLISAQAAGQVIDAWRQREALGGRTLLAPAED
ncbi:succinylglutamic semialdehyde dehydrogenase [Salmonella bongori]|nr:succinylglutamic semialdehyde dehydrogenase [Salmonella bongori]